MFHTRHSLGTVKDTAEGEPVQTSKRALRTRAVRTLACTALVVGALVGCTHTTAGEARFNGAEPTEPTFPTSRPPRSTPPPTLPPPSAPPSTATPPAGIQSLPPENGWVFVQTKSGKTRCQVNADEVDCESEFSDAPTIEGVQAHGVRLTAGGEREWVVGNLGNIPAVTLDYRRYSAEGWTIDAGEDGTRFTNDGTGHGMFISTDGVQVF